MVLRRGGFYVEPNKSQAEMGPSIQDLAIRWTGICIAGAAPSFYYGLALAGPRNIPAMLLGILVFIVAFVCIDHSTRNYEWRANRTIRFSLTTGYVTRVFITIMVPISLFADLYCGVFTVGTLNNITGAEIGHSGNEHIGFVATFYLTVLQGVVLNSVILLLAILVALLHVLFNVSISGISRPGRDEASH